MKIDKKLSASGLCPPPLTPTRDFAPIPPGGSAPDSHYGLAYTLANPGPAIVLQVRPELDHVLLQLIQLIHWLCRYTLLHISPNADSHRLKHMGSTLLDENKLVDTADIHCQVLSV